MHACTKSQHQCADIESIYSFCRYDGTYMCTGFYQYDGTYMCTGCYQYAGTYMCTGFYQYDGIYMCTVFYQYDGTYMCTGFYQYDGIYMCTVFYQYDGTYMCTVFYQYDGTYKCSDYILVLSSYTGTYFNTKNGSSWQPSACQRCSCLGWVTQCRLQRCLAPGCGPDDVLAMVPGHCCPRCARPRRPCQLAGDTYQDGAVWRSGGAPCEECRCLDGSVSCGEVPCPHSPPSCPPGQLLQRGEDECCPRCVATGRPCLLEDDSMKDDGVIWQPLACTKCQCHNGEVQCYLAECPRLVCPANHTLELNPPAGSSSCCPECLGNPCLQDGRVYKSGEQWRPDACHECACQAGRVECHRTTCLAVNCSPGHRPHTEEGDCCPTCIPTEGWCTLPGGEQRSPGALWSGSSCPDVCQCVQGRVSCAPILCPSLVCGHGQRLVQRPEGRCCPDCQRDTGLCFTEGLVKQSGEMWHLGCKLCSCEEGTVTCYTPECPACSPGYTPYYRAHNTNTTIASTSSSIDYTSNSVSDYCCPLCQRVSCSHHCLACEDSLDPLLPTPPDFSLLSFPVLPAGVQSHRQQVSGRTVPACTACDRGYSLQDGACVPRCNRDSFDWDRRCIKCHSSCLTCSEQTKFHCTGCPSGSWLLEGECHDSCPHGYFESSSSSSCQLCHATCDGCHGPTESSCDGCALDAFVAGTDGRLLLLNGTCVRTCPEGFVERAGKCSSCPSSCLTCGVLDECLSCLEPLLLQDGRCQQNCSAAHYLSVDQRNCFKCHPYCKTCTGPGIISCSTCSDHLYLHGSTCLHNCPTNTYPRQGTCNLCDSSCFDCDGPGPNDCMSCTAPLLLSLPPGSSSGACVTTCSPQQLEQHGTCTVIAGCAQHSRSSPYACLRCEDGWLRQEGRCVLECQQGWYQHLQQCLDCDGRCAACSGPGPSNCTACPPRATLFRRASTSSVEVGATCLTKCRQGYYLAPDLACLACDPSCVACVAPRTLGTARCVQCRDAELWTEESSCVASCSAGFYASRDGYTSQSNDIDEGNALENGVPTSEIPVDQIYPWMQRKCLACDESCAECDGPGKNGCTKCPQHRFLTDENSCSDTPCKMGYFQNSAPAPHCEKCASTCLTCKMDANTCTSCPSGLYLLHGQCVPTCGLKYYTNSSSCLECHYSCRGCLGPEARDCLQCATDYLREDNACVASCSPGYFPSADGTECHFCPTGCHLCTGPPHSTTTNSTRSNAAPTCQACRPPYLLHRGACLTDCPKGASADVWEHKCTECPPNCRMCSSLKCLGCEKSYYLQNGLCVKKCGENYHVVERNISTCVSNVYQPILNILSPLVVEYGLPRVLNSSVVHIFDRDTSEEDLKMVLVEAPSNGHLSRASGGKNDRLHKGDYFTAKDLREGRIIFNHERESSFYGEMSFRLSDGEFETNPTVISINVMSTFKPRIVVNEPLIVRRGGRAHITKNELRLIDQDSPEAVNILVRDGPEFGRLTIDDEDLALFSLQELSNNVVTYIHTNPEEFLTTKSPMSLHDRDQVLLQARDGHNVVNFRLKIIFVDSNKPAPVIIKNKGLKLERGKRRQITPDILQARDVDSRDESLVYSVFSETRNGRRGEFVLVIPRPPAAAGLYSDGWVQMDESHLVRPTSSFSQRDLNEGRVWYVTTFEQDGGPTSEPTVEVPRRASREGSARGYPYSEPFNRGHLYGAGSSIHSQEQQRNYSEVIVFSVSDSSDPPNVLKDQTFVVQIEEPLQVKKNNVSAVTDLQLVFEVLEGQALTFTAAELNMLPHSSASKHSIVYTITRPLGPDDGVLFHIESPGLELVEFTQFDIDNMKIIYLPPFASVGLEEKTYSFKFKVSDSPDSDASPKLPEHKLTIRVVAVAKEQLSFTNPDPVLLLAAHGTVELSQDVFELSNSHADDLVLFVLQEGPRHGHITVTPLAINDAPAITFTKEVSLTMQEVRNSRLVYKNTASVAQDSAVILALGQSSELVTRVTFKIELEDRLMPVASPLSSFSISVEEGSSTMLSPDIIYFNDMHTNDDDLVYTLATVTRLGSLILSSFTSQPYILNATHKFVQKDIREGRLIFSADAEVGASEQRDVIRFDVTDPSNNVLTNQELKITILPMDNQAPVLTVEGSGRVEVEEGSSVLLTPTLLRVVDPDTPPNRLRVVLVVPPVFGYITVHPQGGPETGTSQFPLSLLQEGRLHYRQSKHQRQEPRRDAMILFVTDGLRNTQSFRVNITILPRDDERPELLAKQLLVPRGRKAVLDDAVLAVSDDDTPLQRLMITVEGTPNHGYLFLKSEAPGEGNAPVLRGQELSLDDISSGRVLYEHDGSATHADRVLLKVSDGVHDSKAQLDFLIQNISISNNEEEDQDKLEPSMEIASLLAFAPKMIRNHAITVIEGHRSLLNTDHLKAVVERLPNAQVEYVLQQGPSVGALEEKLPRSNEWRPLRVGDDFTQAQLDNGMLRYSHHRRSGGVADQLLLDLHISEEAMDKTLGPYESLLSQVFKIQVLPDDAPPIPVRMSRLHVEENQKVVITRDVVQWEDPGSNEAVLISYNVIRAPTKGSLKLVSHPHHVATSWTQQDIDSGNLFYQQNRSIEATEDSFTFTVSDGKNKAEEQTLMITISPVDDLPTTVIVAHPLVVERGSRQLLTVRELAIVDDDTPDDQLVLRVTVLPRHGTLQRHATFDSSAWQDVQEFSMDDIIEKRISFLHDGSGAPSDRFHVIVAGSNSVLQENSVTGVSDLPNSTVVPVQIVTLALRTSEAKKKESSAPAVTDGDALPPSKAQAAVISNRGLQYLEKREDGKVVASIWPASLEVAYLSHPPASLSFLLTYPPQHGSLLLRGSGGPATSFTQDDINKGKLQYELDASIDRHTYDHFKVDVFVNNKTEPILKELTVSVDWSWLAIDNTVHNISKRHEAVNIAVSKIGKLDHESSVLCSATDGSLNVTSIAKFTVGQSKSYCAIEVDDNSIFNEPKLIDVVLLNAKRSLIGHQWKTVIAVSDSDGQSVIGFASSNYVFDESDGTVDVKVMRTGDVRAAASALCTTEDGTAIGGNSAAMKGNDYVRRPRLDTSMVVFFPGQRETTCHLIITNDNTFELSESFYLLLAEPSQSSVLSKMYKTVVTIRGPNDGSVLQMKNSLLFVDEKDTEIAIIIQRTGENVDYACSATCELSLVSGDKEETELSEVIFAPDSTTSSCQFNAHHFNWQDNPEYKVIITNAVNASITPTADSTTILVMPKQDTTVIEFNDSFVVVREPQGFVDIPLVRNGNLSTQVSVNCFTRSRTAAPPEDYIDRPKLKNSTITFNIGIDKALCRLNLVDDNLYEEDEMLLVKLAHPEGVEDQRVSLGKHKIVRVKIENPEDQPKISFMHDNYKIGSPEEETGISHLFIELERKGDISKSSRVRIITRDVTAMADLHYLPLDDIVNFDAQQRRAKFMVQVKYVAEWHGDPMKFHVIMTSLDLQSSVVATIKGSSDSSDGTAIATVNIMKSQTRSSSVLTLPARPLVVSLQHYDVAAEHGTGRVDPGYPLVCVSPCETRYPSYRSMRSLCEKIGLGPVGGWSNKSSINYMWEISVPGNDGHVTPFQPILDSTIFAKSDQKVLDSMFIAPNFFVKCVCTVVSENGQAGTPLQSEVVKVVSEGKGICPRKPNRGIAHNTPYLRQQELTATLSYVNITDDDHPNTVCIDVSVPHEDGMLPLISTVPIQNIRYLLTEQLYRTHHACSNLHAGAAFMEQRAEDASRGKPHQWNTALRQQRAVTFYRHLDLAACKWRFTAWFSLTQLTEQCGGSVTTDFLIGAGDQSLLSVRVPLHVSYVFASASPPGWTSLDTRTELAISFYYDTLLWRQGLSTVPSLSARIQVTRVSLDQFNRLVVDFKTMSKFRGQFVERHPGLTTEQSTLLSPDHLSLFFNLRLLWSASTFDGAEQVWRASSSTSLPDYTGEYRVLLLPCTVRQGQSYALLNITDTLTSASDIIPTSYPLSAKPPSGTPTAAVVADPFSISDVDEEIFGNHQKTEVEKWTMAENAHVVPVCEPHEPTVFVLPLSIRPPIRPVLPAFTLETRFQLFRDEDAFMQDPDEVDNPQESEFIGSYGPDDRVLGRLLWHPRHKQLPEHVLRIQRLYVCAATDGHVPTYDPSGSLYGEGRQYGCLQPHPLLLHRSLVLDRGHPELPLSTDLNPLGVKAYLAESVDMYDCFRQMPGIDAFVMETKQMFSVSSGHQWFLQVLYTIGPYKSRRTRREETEVTVMYSTSPSPGSALHVSEQRSDGMTKGAAVSARPAIHMQDDSIDYYVESSTEYYIGETDRGENYTNIDGVFYSSDPQGIGDPFDKDYLKDDSNELLPSLSRLKSTQVRNGTNIRPFSLRYVDISEPLATSRSTLSYVLYILLAVFVLLGIVVGVLLLVWRHYKGRRKTDDIVVVKSLKNEREECRRRDRESWGDKMSPMGSPVTLNSESNLQTVKVKTLAITVRNNLEEEGTEV